MGNQGNSIDWALKFKIDKNGFNQLRQEFKDIQQNIKEIQQFYTNPVQVLQQNGATTGEAFTLAMKANQETMKAGKELARLDKQIQKMDQALVNSYNATLGTINMSKFTQELDTSKIKLDQFYKLLNKPEVAGGKQAFHQLTAEILGTNLQLKQTSEFMNNLMVSFGNTVKWGITSSIFNNITNSIQGAWTYAKNLDTSLNNIRVVTGKSGDEMERFAREANRAAAALGKSTTDYTNASLIYYQQGLPEEEVKARSETTLKAASVTGQSAEAVSEQLTAVWNGYKVSAEETELYIDKLAAVAAATAADLEELSVGMSKVASAASLMGVDIDQLSAQMATIISVTRQAPESVGTALKTIYARMGDIEAGVDEETTLGEYTKKMAEMGVNVLDAKGNLRDMGEVIEEIGSKWTSMTREQQLALSQIIAGTRQYNNLLALFDNWENYTETLQISTSAFGTLQQQQDIYMESTAAHLEKLGTAWEKVFDAFFNNEGMNTLIDGIAGIVNVLGSGLEGIGGGFTLILGLSGKIADILKKNIAPEIANWIEQTRNQKENTEQIKKTYEIISQLQKIGVSKNAVKNDKAFTEIVEFKKHMLDLRGVLTEAEQNEANYLIKMKAHAEAEKALLEEKKRNIQEYISVLSQQSEYQEGTFHPTNKPSKKELKQAEESGEKVFYTYNEKEQNEILNAGMKQWGILSAKPGEMSADLDSITKQIKEGTQDAAENIQMLAQEIQTGLIDNIEHLEKMNTEGILGVLFDPKSAEFTEYQTLLAQAAAYKKGKSPVDANKNLPDFTTVVENYQADRIYGKQAYDESVKWIDKFSQSYEKAVSKAEKLTKEALSYVKGDMAATERKVVNNLNKIDEAIENTTKTADLRASIAGWIEFVGAIGQVSSAVMGLVNSFKILGDTSISTGEKMLSFITSLAYALPMLASGFSAMQPAINKIGVSLGVANTAGVKGFLSVVKAALGAKVAIGGVAVTVGVLAAAVVAAVAGIALLVHVFQAESRAAEHAQETAKQLAQTYADLKTEAEEFKKSITGYEEGIKQLKEMATTADEYKDSLKKVNEQARELIKNNKLIEGTDYVWENGALVIKHEVLATLEDNMDAKVQEAESTAAFGKAISYISNPESDLSQAEDKSYTYYRDDTEHSTSFNRSEILSIVDAFADMKARMDEQSYSSMLSNAEADTNLALISELEYQLQNRLPENLKYSAEAIAQNATYFDQLTDKLKDFSGALQSSTDVLLTNVIQKLFGDKITELATDKTTGKVNQARAAQIQKVIEKTSAGQDAEDSITQGVAAKSRKDIERNISGVWNSQVSKQTNGAYVIDNDEDLARTYAEVVLKKTKDEVANLAYVAGNDQGKLTDLEGNVVMDWMNDDEMRVRIIQEYLRAQAEAAGEEQLKNSTTGVDIAESMIEKGSEAGKKYGTDFTDALLNAFTDPNKKINLTSIFKDFSPSEVEEIRQMTTQEIVDLFGADEETLKDWGYTDAYGKADEEKFASSVKGGFEGYTYDLDSAITDALNRQIEGDEEDSKKKQEQYREEIEAVAKQLMETTKSEDEFSDSLAENADKAVEAARALVLMDKGVQNLHDNIEDWTAALKNNDKMSADYAMAIQGIAESLGDILGVERDYINNDFVVSHMSDIKLAADGNVEAINRLHDALNTDMISSWAEFGKWDDSTVKAITAETKDIKDQFEDIDIGIGFTVDSGEAEKEVIESMQNIIDQAGLSVDQANALFKNLGYSVEYEENTAPTTVMNVPETTSESTVEWEGITPKIVTKTWQSGTRPITGGVAVSSMKTITADGQEGNVQKPKIKKATKLPGADQISKPTDKNKGGGSGNKDKMDKFKVDIDRFHDIDIVLGKIQNNLEEIENAQEKAFGKDLLEEYNKELLELDKNLAATDEKIRIAEEWMKDLREGNPERGIEKGLEASGFLFNDDGEITNYEAWFLQKEKDIQALRDKYNAMGEGDDKKKYKEDVIQPAEDEFDRIKEWFEKYEELKYDTIPELLLGKEDDINRQIETQIAKFNTEITIRLDLKEAEEDWNEFRRNVLEDLDDSDILRNAELDLENFSLYYKDNENGIIQAGTRQVNNILAELKSMDETGWSQVYGDNRIKALEDLKTYYDQLKSDLTDIDTLVENIQKSYINMMGEAKKAFSEQVSTYKQVSGILNHDMKIIQLLNGEDSYKELDKYYEKLERNNREQLDFQKQQVDFWKEEMDSLDPLEDKEAWETAKKNWQSAVNDWYAMIESSIENLQDKYLNSIEKIFDELNDKVTNGKGLDYVSEEWDLLGQNSDEFLDEINALYGIEDIARKYQNSIDNTDNLTTQKKLKEVMEEELEALREKDKLTEYDIERAEKKYDLTLKQIALEEAQQNKSQLRLRRDSQGNYTYQYVADEDEIGKLEEELAAAQNELYNFDLEQYKDKLGQLYDVYEEFQDKMKEAAQINDPEERAARELLLQQQYGELINGLVAQNEDIRNNLYESAFAELAALRDQDLADYTDLTQQQKDLLMNDLIPQWNSGVQEMADVFAGEGGFIPTCSEAMEELDEATDEYEKELEQLEKAAGANFDEISRGIDETVEDTQDLIEENDKLIDKYEEEMDSIALLMEDLDDLIEKYEDAKEAAEAATEAAYNYWRTENEDAAEEAKNDKYRPPKEEISFEKPTVEEPVSEPTSPQGDGEISVGDTVTFIGGSGRWYADSFGGGTSGTSSSDRQVTITRIASNSRASHPYHIDSLGWVKKSQLKGYDTGGYTGTWGDEGRLALLHQKELVLNAQDTSNMLSAVEILRDITNTIGSTMLNRLAQLNGNANGLLAHVGAETMEQNVHIDATFPNVQNSNEIEEAFKNLTNIAAQRAFRS